jgi:ureidoglycolate amidohydrolase
VESAALLTCAIDTVATVGICKVHPGAINSIPGRVDLTVDLRDTDEKRRDGVLAAIKAACNEVAEGRKVAVKLEMINADAPAISSPQILDVLAAACEAEKVTHKRMVSRAYHDSSFMAQIAPIAMVFIPCRDGVSHRPDEYASPEDISRGVKVLARTLATLSA